MGESADAATSATTERTRVEAGEIGYALRELSQSFRLYERHLAHLMQLKPTEYQAMEHILDGGGTLGPLELSARLGLAPGTTSELVDRLQNLGHVVRNRGEDDRRRVNLAPTSAATGRIVAAISPALHDLGLLAEGFPPAEQEVILRFLREASATLTSHASRDEQGSA